MKLTRDKEETWPWTWDMAKSGRSSKLRKMVSICFELLGLHRSHVAFRLVQHLASIYVAEFVSLNLIMPGMSHSDYQPQGPCVAERASLSSRNFADRHLRVRIRR